jgi:hypothetical protein
MPQAGFEILMAIYHHVYTQFMGVEHFIGRLAAKPGYGDTPI